MSSRRIKSEPLWDEEEESGPQNETKYFGSNFFGNNSPKRLNSETNDVLMSADFSTRELVQGNENMLMDNHKHRVKTEPTFDEWESQYGSRPSDNNFGQPYRVKDRSRSRSSSPNQTRGLGPHRDHTRGRDPGRARASPSRGSGATRPEYSGARSRDEETRDYHRNNRIGYNDQDHRHSNQSVKPPCRFFLRGNCNRNRCKFSHDPNPNSDTFHNSDPNFSEKNKSWNDPNPNSDTFHNSDPDFDEKSKSWNDPSWNNPESGGFDDVSRDIHMGIKQESQLDGQQIHPYGQYISSQLPTNLNGNGPIEASRNNNPQVTSETLANALGLLHSLPNPPSSSGPIDSKVNEPVKTGLLESQSLVEPVKYPEVNETLTGQPENTNLGKPEVQVKVEEGNIGNDEKAMRAFKTALVEFVKEILKPTWKEGKMNREDYKTIVKKVVDKVTSTIQGNQIPRTQEKIDQYLSFSKSKITKLVEAYVGRFQKA